MQSINFEFLRAKWPELAGLGGFAESYAHGDPIGAIAKLRAFCEQTAKFIHHQLRLPRLIRPNLIDLLDDSTFQSAVPRVVVSKLHALRIEGNQAVHGNRGDTTTALRLLKEAYDLGRWLYVNFAGGRVEDCPPYTPPAEGGAEAAQRRREKRAILERIAAQEAQMQELLENLEAERARAATAEASAAELQLALEAGQQAAAAVQAVDPLSFDEQQTRKYLIDVMLAEAGWNVAETNNPELVREEPIEYQTTKSGTGYADYVLKDDNGKPLGVIEAKKTAQDPEAGRTQAKRYADGLEAEHGQRPVIFYTNGYDLWIWNDAVGEPPRKIYGYYSKDSLQHLHFQRKQRKALADVGPDKSKNIITRLYQFEAVRRIVESFGMKRRKGLIVMATGTGKTRVAIALCDALIQACWAKFDMFQCGTQDPTFNYSFEEAIANNPPYLVPFVVDTHTTPFLRAGIKYSQMTDEQRRQLEEDEQLPQAIEFEQAEVDRQIFNKDTNRIILRNLMEHGIRVADGSRLGKTIIFARNHNHAVLLQNLFDGLYPQYGGSVCRVIDTYDPRAEELIDDFKGEGTNPDLTIAISVDMLDTGIDVPAIVNLVFAKPLYSYVKFWQMIGRGTRLCPDVCRQAQSSLQKSVRPFGRISEPLRRVKLLIDNNTIGFVPNADVADRQYQYAKTYFLRCAKKTTQILPAST
jgi:hypothetical protein